MLDSDRIVLAEDVENILKGAPAKELRQLEGLTDRMIDLEPDALESMPKHIEMFRRHAYHEIAYRAQIASIQRDPVVALILACAALEGAHAHFVRTRLAERLASHKRGEQLIEDLLREQGIYTLLQVSVAFLVDAHRPSEEVLASCLNALTIRNSIVHAKQKKGQYKLRSYTAGELYAAVSAVMKVFRQLVGDEADRAVPAG